MAVSMKLGGGELGGLVSVSILLMDVLPPGTGHPGGVGRGTVPARSGITASWMQKAPCFKGPASLGSASSSAPDIFTLFWLFLFPSDSFHLTVKSKEGQNVMRISHPGRSLRVCTCGRFWEILEAEGLCAAPSQQQEEVSTCRWQTSQL